MRRFLRRSAGPDYGDYADLDDDKRVGEARAVHRQPVLFVEPTRFQVGPSSPKLGRRIRRGHASSNNDPTPVPSSDSVSRMTSSPSRLECHDRAHALSPRWFLRQDIHRPQLIGANCIFAVLAPCRSRLRKAHCLPVDESHERGGLEPPEKADHASAPTDVKRCHARWCAAAVASASSRIAGRRSRQCSSQRRSQITGRSGGNR